MLVPAPFVALTFDIDWAHDAVLADAFTIVAKSGVPATWFVTHATTLLKEIRAEGHELGLHPNFNPPLAGTRNGAMGDIFERCQALVPDARAVRSHSLVRSSRLSQMFRRCGMTHESNIFVHPAAGPVLPWRDWEGLVQTAIRWEDDLYLIDPSIGDSKQHFGELPALVVDFHPIHIFLNSLNIEDYESSRPYHNDPPALLALRRPPGVGGARDQLHAILTHAREVNTSMLRVSEIAPANGAWPCV